MKKIVLFFMLIGLGLTLNSCYYNKFPIVDPNPPAVPDFDSIKEQIL